MFDSLLAWISGAPDDGSSRRQEELHLALTALLIEAAHSDDRFDEAERAVIAQLIERRFKLTRPQTRELIAAGEREADRAAELYHLTRIVNERLNFQQRVDLVEMLWEVAYADGILDPYEDSLLRRIGGLIYVSDRERGMARQRVLERRGLDQAV
jgi:uncharacterized tellurite resistance protein B-like protein